MKNTISALSLSAFMLYGSETMANQADALGKWDLYLPTPDGVDRVIAEFSGEPGSYTGIMEGKKGRVELKNVKLDGDSFSFEHDIEKLFMTMTVNFSGSVEGDRIEGEVETPMGMKAFKGVRP